MICFVWASAFCWNLLMAGLLAMRTAPGLRCFRHQATTFDGARTLAAHCPLLRPVPHNVTLLSQSKTKRERRRIAGTAACGGEPDAPHNRITVRWSDRTCRRIGVRAKRQPA